MVTLCTLDVIRDQSTEVRLTEYCTVLSTESDSDQRLRDRELLGVSTCILLQYSLSVETVRVVSIIIQKYTVIPTVETS